MYRSGLLQTSKHFNAVKNMAEQAVITATELQRASGKMLKRVVVDKEHLVIERAGYPVAVMLSYPEYEKLIREQALVKHRNLVTAIGGEAEQQALTEEALMAELEEAKQAVYQETYGQ